MATRPIGRHVGVDRPLAVAVLGAVVVFALALAIGRASVAPAPPAATPATGAVTAMPAPSSPTAVAAPATEVVAATFERGVAMMRDGDARGAVRAFHEVLALAPRMPEAHVNLGFAFLALGEPGVAHDFFQGALALRVEQVNAYFGLGQALEALGDLEGARGAMRAYLHLAPADEPWVARARAALWEWERTAGARR
ncbi:MAG: tetratricopeptide repeat protein [Ectothiorhodospiraceae bacterium]|nr:tetratricopeptide repeat protein [Chromatiales bacterium]MCP5154588.1 tetratricopeptide repeat protein [Ectothiorhodospiraceae bacterium]